MLLATLLAPIVNLLIVAKLFTVEYSAYNGSIEGTFIGLARLMTKYPGQWQWWPFWNGGLPFELTYLPFTHWIVAGFSALTSLSAARSFHIVSAAIYVIGALAVFWMALELSRRLLASLIAALAYSCLSVSTLLIPAIRADAGGLLNLRRLQVLVFYGEAPHTAALALLPLAIVCFSRALTTRRVKWQLLAGVAAACVALSNAFGMMMLAVALVCWLLAFPQRPWWRAPLTVAAIGVWCYCWISPWLSPAMIRALRANAATSGGNYRYTPHTWIALALCGAGFLLLWLVTRLCRASSHLRFFLLFSYAPTAIVAVQYVWNIAIVPQPHRYHLEMDLVLLLAFVFAVAAIVERLPRPLRVGIAVLVLCALALQVEHAIVYGNRLIQATDPRGLSEYKVATWLDRNRPGERAFLPGSETLIFNAFSDSPQLTGGHDQHTANTFLLVVNFVINSGMNAGDRDADYSIFWLKAYGAHLISVPGPGSTDYYKPIVHPRKFDGVLPLVWREGGDFIYQVPARSSSLAHVIPTAAIVTRRPIHGLDIAPAAAYVAALDDPQFPPATFRWKSLSEAEIETDLQPGQAVGVQETYERGWEAWANGKRQRVFGDALGQTVIAPDCLGRCRIVLLYTGGWEHAATRAMSLAATLFAIGFAWRRRRLTVSKRVQ